MRVDVILDGSHQRRDVFERAATNAFVCDFPEPTFDQVEPRTGRGDKMQMESRMTFQPRLDPGMFVRAVVVFQRTEKTIRMG